MKVIFYVVLVVLIFLAVSSGITKIMLMPRDAEFFGQYGFTNPILIGYGISQLLGGILLAIPKSRVFGAIIVAITFLISVVILILADNIAVAVITLIFILLLGFIINKSLDSDKQICNKVESL